jgi:hypothetical protein
LYFVAAGPGIAGAIRNIYMYIYKGAKALSLRTLDVDVMDGDAVL